MKIIADSREQRNAHILEELSNQGIPFKLKKLDYGDYSIEGYENRIIVERKQNLTELAGNFCKGRKRFEAEFVRATEAGAKIHLLIEQEDARERMLKRRELDKDRTLTAMERQKGTWRTQFCANAMINAIASWKIKYNFDIIFCAKKDSGKVIVDIFNKYLRGLEDDKELQFDRTNIRTV